MALHFSANQYEGAYEPRRLNNWEIPKYFPPRPRQHFCVAKFVVDERGRLLPNVKKDWNPWGYFRNTWQLPNKLTRKAGEQYNACLVGRIRWQHYHKPRTCDESYPHQFVIPGCEPLYTPPKGYKPLPPCEDPNCPIGGDTQPHPHEFDFPKCDPEPRPKGYKPLPPCEDCPEINIDYHISRICPDKCKLTAELLAVEKARGKPLPPCESPKCPRIVAPNCTQAFRSVPPVKVAGSNRSYAPTCNVLTKRHNH